MIRELLANRENWGKIAVIDSEKHCTYRELAQKAAAVQALLTGKQRGHVALFLPNSADYISALYGVFMSGMTAYPLNVQLTASELAPLLNQASVQTVITSAAQRGLFEKLPHQARLEIVVMEDLAPLQLHSPPKIQEVAPGTPIVLLTTSGTTGSAKLVQLTEQNIETAVLGFIAYNDYGRFSDIEIRYLLGTPFSSVYGMLILPVCLQNAFPIVLYEGSLTPDILYCAAEQHGVSHYEGGTTLPILMDRMREKEIPYCIDSIRFVGFGGSKVPREVLERLGNTFPSIEFCPGYGMTESAALIARPYKKVKKNKLESIGRAIPNVAVQVDVGGSITDTPRAVGELVVQGPNVMPGYYQNREESDRILQNGWLYTGDIGYVDEEGDIFLCGRKKNVILVRGFSVYAEELEASLQGSGLVKECRVYSEAGEGGAEVLCAQIVPRTKEVCEEDIRQWCNLHLAGYKQPRNITFVDAISKTATGKVARATVKTNGVD